MKKLLLLFAYLPVMAAAQMDYPVTAKGIPSIIIMVLR